MKMPLNGEQAVKVKTLTARFTRVCLLLWPQCAGTRRWRGTERATEIGAAADRAKGQRKERGEGRGELLHHQMPSIGRCSHS